MQPLIRARDGLFAPEPCAPPLPILESLHPWALAVAVLLAVLAAAGAAVWRRSGDPAVSRAGGIVGGLGLVGAVAGVVVWLLTGIGC